jgi:hypothetical protein
MAAGATNVTAEAWAELKSLPARLKALEQKISGAVTSADVPGKVSEYETKLQGYLTDLENMNIPARIEALETELAQMRSMFSGAAGNKGTLAQQTSAPATKAK